MKQKKLLSNPYLLFLPFFLVYLAYVLLVQQSSLWGDEIRHYDEAIRFLSGHFVDPAGPVEIRNGPGYPLWIALFLLLKIPLIVLKMINAVLIYLSIVLLFKTLRYYVSFRLSLLVSVFWGCYYHNLDFMPYLYAESASVFLMVWFLYLVVKAIHHEGLWKNKYIYYAAIVFGYLVITKVIFGYVMVALLFGSLFFWLFNRKAETYKKAILIQSLALITVIPYLSLTYSHTGKFFYLVTSGGNNLYWMSTPYPNEYGSWFPATMMHLDLITNHGDDPDRVVDTGIRNTNYMPGTADSIRAHHEAAFRDIYQYTGVQRDEAFKRYYFENVKSHPKKYLMNVFTNAGRILFNYPFTYQMQKPGTLLRLPLNGTILLFSILCLLPTVLNWKRLPFAVRYMLLLSIIYFGGSLLGSSEIRMFNLIAPLLILWIATILEGFVRIRLKYDKPFGTG